ncbi:polyprenyl glycosylphosphotransferase [Marinitoga sp. 1154]|uniref:sugar transferase n=1 Tax=Marinitoga sp. 1154 TaxID=1643335 RepID=UPI0015869000|nr:sugar transferase [Marinitoga sp. 1154]NUU99619.1 polyprenyl glycosylphosphotransferase [Marinitoga sp. 1154]
MKINSNFLKLIDYIFLMVFNLYITQNIYISFIFSTSIYLGIYAFRTYDFENIESWNDTIIRVFAGTMLGFLVISTFYVIFDGYILKEYFLDNFVFNIIALPIIHKISYYILLKNITPKKYIVIGKKEEWHKLMNEIEKKSLGKLQFVEYINPSPVKLKKLIKVYDGVLIADPELEKLVIDEINEFKENGVKVEYLPVIVERFLKRIPIQVAEKFKSHYEVAFSEIKESPAKRIVDIFFSLILLILFSPVIIISYLLIFFEDGKPVVFKQKRVGQNEKTFVLIKFRTLKDKKDENRFSNPNERIDNHVLFFGKFLRKTRLDEVLQFFNVLNGTMSIVGPRPEMEHFHNMAKENIPMYVFRLKLKPGITGWAQINYKHTTTLEDYIRKTEYDLYYIKNRKWLLDFKIMIQTVETIFGLKGSK